MNSSATAQNVLSVTSLNRLARSLLETNFSTVIVEGEISNLAMPSSGHWYLTLKDSAAQIRCAMFVNRNRLVRFKPGNGNQVVVRGKLSIYEGRGDYQLIAESMEEAGDGALRRAFEALKLSLQEEGLFDVSAKQEVLSRYDHVGVITSPSGAAIRDIISVFARRFPATRLTLIPVAVQGKEAASEIVRAIDLANKLADKLGIQALIVGRGGGSLEDLQPFNEETVARAIYASSLPITSAVGHEIDFTIADFAADQRAPTPSAAAELMSPSQQEYFDSIHGYRSTLIQLIKARITQSLQTLQWLKRQFKRPDRRLQEHAQTLDRLESQMLRVIQQQLQGRRAGVTQLQRTLLANSPTNWLRRTSLQLLSGTKRLKRWPS
jgi:exodeoxyribonuclease VII large subunit